MPADRETLLDIWLRSVRATHTFLGEPDVQGLLPAVRDYLSSPDSELWTLCSERTTPTGFMGLADNNVEALFVAPEHARRGGGRLLLEHARKLKGPLRVDVNEQNPEAVRFYEANGFQVIGRSPVNAGGRPFPFAALAGSCELSGVLARRMPPGKALRTKNVSCHASSWLWRKPPIAVREAVKPWLL